MNFLHAVGPRGVAQNGIASFKISLSRRALACKFNMTVIMIHCGAVRPKSLVWRRKKAACASLLDNQFNFVFSRRERRPPVQRTRWQLRFRSPPGDKWTVSTGFPRKRKSERISLLFTTRCHHCGFFAHVVFVHTRHYYESVLGHSIFFLFHYVYNTHNMPASHMCKKQHLYYYTASLSAALAGPFNDFK